MPEPDAYKVRSGLAHGGSMQEQDEVQAIIRAMRARRRTDGGRSSAGISAGPAHETESGHDAT